MHLNKALNRDVTAMIIVRPETEERLKKTCFRGVPVQKAGNFALWESADDLFQDETVIKHFLDELEECWQEDNLGTHSLCIECDLPIGWESTDEFSDKYEPHALEEFNLNRRSWGLRVKADRTDLLAPSTQSLTIIFEFKDEDGAPVAVIHSIYPGVDIGELRDNVTAREDRIFFDWEHPGQNPRG